MVFSGVVGDTGKDGMPSDRLAFATRLYDAMGHTQKQQACAYR